MKAIICRLVIGINLEAPIADLRLAWKRRSLAVPGSDDGQIFDGRWNVRDPLYLCRTLERQSFYPSTPLVDSRSSIDSRLASAPSLYRQPLMEYEQVQASKYSVQHLVFGKAGRQESNLKITAPHWRVILILVYNLL